MTRHLLPEEFDLLVDAEAGIDAGFGVAELRAHARACPACAAELEAARAVAAELDALPHFLPSTRFADRVMQDVQVFEPWHVAVGDAARRLVPESRPLRAAAAAGALGSGALLTLVLTWLLARADVLAFSGDAALTRFRRRWSIATLLAILNSQLENLNSGLYLSMWLRTLTKLSCARSSAASRSRTMRYTIEKTGRS